MDATSGRIGSGTIGAVGHRPGARAPEPAVTALCGVSALARDDADLFAERAGPGGPWSVRWKRGPTREMDDTAFRALERKLSGEPRVTLARLDVADGVAVLERRRGGLLHGRYPSRPALAVALPDGTVSMRLFHLGSEVTSVVERGAFWEARLPEGAPGMDEMALQLRRAEAEGCLADFFPAAPGNDTIFRYRQCADAPGFFLTPREWPGFAAELGRQGAAVNVLGVRAGAAGENVLAVLRRSVAGVPEGDTPYAPAEIWVTGDGEIGRAYRRGGRPCQPEPAPEPTRPGPAPR